MAAALSIACGEDGSRQSSASGASRKIEPLIRVTPEQATLWREAQLHLEAEPEYAALEAPDERIDLRNPSDDAIERAVARLEEKPRVRTSIERTGLSVREYVMIAIALQQHAMKDSAK